MQRWIQEMRDLYGDMPTMDGYDDCIIGVCTSAGQEPKFAYNKEMVIKKLMNEGMSESEAVEFHEYNQAGAYLGIMTPVFIETNGLE